MSTKDQTQKTTSKYFATESDILKFWQENQIFEKSVNNRPESKQWNFLDGPPFVTGMPHYGHIIGSILKDVFPRFKTMQGYRVRRVWGWDCHGLPAENKVENALGLKNKKEIEEKVGIAKFIEECKKYVGEVSSEWEWYVSHIGRFVDFKNSYRTMDLSYMESVMWVFAQMYKKNYIYKGLRVSLYCPHCETPISNFEVAMDSGENYKTVSEPSNTYMYKVTGQKDTYILAWSTTPWTKLTTVALAVNPSLTYVRASYNGKTYILARDTLQANFKQIGANLEEVKIQEELTGASLAGLQYEPHFANIRKIEGKKLNVVVADEFVTATDGTGVVTLAAYGEEDLRVMKAHDIQIELNVTDNGVFDENSPAQFVGQYYLKANPLINAAITGLGLMFAEDRNHEHSVAHCWRCHERLIFKPQEAWYVNIQAIKPDLLKNNESINWFPAHFKDGRFRKSVEGAPDWCISRSRYWGSPVPVWECECGSRFVPESLSELSAAAGVQISDLHKPGIDDVEVKCQDCGKPATRVTEVLDSWIEAGSAAFAERHFPFESKDDFDKFFPTDFISEYTGQIRAWFYVLHVISTALYNKPSFKNVLVSGVILGTDGRKMSKNYKNYPDPRTLIEQYGGDALRLYLLGSPITRGQDINISEAEYKDQLRTFIIPLLNIYNFYKMYAVVDGYNVGSQITEPKTTNVLDLWAISYLNTTIKAVTNALETYDTPLAVKLITEFVDNLSRWYIRRCRDRAGAGELTPDTKSYYETITYVLERFLRLCAPIVPFHSEHLYLQLLGGSTSVHLQDYPVAVEALINIELEAQTRLARQICELGHNYRKANNLKVRMPLAKILLELPDLKTNLTPELWGVVLDELNCKNIKVNNFSYPEVEVTVTEAELEHEGALRDLMRDIQVIRKELGLKIDQKAKIILPKTHVQFAADLEKIKNVESVEEGEKLEIKV